MPTSDPTVEEEYDLDQDVDPEDVAEAAFAMMIAEEERVPEDTPIFIQAKGGILALWEEIDQGVKTDAEDAQEWLVKLFRQAPKFNELWEEIITDPTDPSKNAIVPKNGRVTTLLPPFLQVHDVQGQKIWGMVMILAIAMSLNATFQEVVNDAVVRDEPISRENLQSISRGNARLSADVGVYLLTSDTSDGFIIGQAVSKGFRGRLNGKLYSMALKVCQEFGAGDGRQDQRTNRSDHIMFSVDALTARFSSIRWLCFALESLSIIVSKSHDASIGGLNTNVSDYRFLYEGLTPKQLVDIWNVFLEVTQSGHRIPSRKGSLRTTGNETFDQYYRSWLKPDPRIPTHFASETLHKLLHILAPLAKECRYSKFPPLVESAFLYRQPLPRGLPTIIYKEKVRRNAQPRGMATTGLTGVISDDVRQLANFVLPNLDSICDGIIARRPNLLAHQPTRRAHNVGRKRKPMKVVSDIHDEQNMVEDSGDE